MKFICKSQLSVENNSTWEAGSSEARQSIPSLFATRSVCNVLSVGRNISVSIAIRYGLGGPGIESCLSQ